MIIPKSYQNSKDKSIALAMFRDLCPCFGMKYVQEWESGDETAGGNL